MLTFVETMSCLLPTHHVRKDRHLTILLGKDPPKCWQTVAKQRLAIMVLEPSAGEVSCDAAHAMHSPKMMSHLDKAKWQVLLLFHPAEAQHSVLGDVPVREVDSAGLIQFFCLTGRNVRCTLFWSSCLATLYTYIV